MGPSGAVLLGGCIVNFDELARIAVENGATKATVIPVEKIVLSSVFRDICKSNGCGNYGRCWMCPPDVGEIDVLMDKVRSYDYGVLYQTIVEIEDSFDIEGMTAGSARHAANSRKIRAALNPVLGEEVFHLTCGGCRGCETCAKKEGLPCRNPASAMPSMESCGIDVYNTTKGTELKYINGENTVTYFGIALFREESHA